MLQEREKGKQLKMNEFCCDDCYKKESCMLYLLSSLIGTIVHCDRRKEA